MTAPSDVLERFKPAPLEGEERDAFIQMNPSSFLIRHPPAPDKLVSFVTDDDLLFQTLHMGAAEVDVDKWTLAIDGQVERPFALTLDQLRQLPEKRIKAFHECYGSPLVAPKDAPALRRVGNIEWTGVALSHILELAGVKPEANFVWSEGLDRGKFANVSADRYQKDLPIDKAKAPEVLIAYEMNSLPLSRNRGGPVRLVVPGWFGTNSTKWLCKLSVQDRRAPGPFTTTFYNEKYPLDDPTCESRPIWRVQPNSCIVRPAPESQLSEQQLDVEGWAWSDDGIREVSISSDEGETWIPARLEDRTDYSWQKFQASLRLQEGKHTLLARATSLDGRLQPLEVGRNHAHRVSIEVA